jgi:WD40 repeat protein
LLAGGEDGLLRVWDCATGSLVAAYPAHRSRVYAVAVSPDGRLAASGGADGELRVWDLTPSGVMRCRFTAKESAAVRCLAFARDGEVVAAGYEDGVVALRNSSGHLVPMLHCRQHQDWVRAITFNNGCSVPWVPTARGLDVPPGDVLLTCGDDDRVVAWARRDGHWCALFDSQPADESIVALSWTGAGVLAGADSGTVYFSPR